MCYILSRFSVLSKFKMKLLTNIPQIFYVHYTLRKRNYFDIKIDPWLKPLPTLKEKVVRGGYDI